MGTGHVIFLTPLVILVVVATQYRYGNYLETSTSKSPAYFYTSADIRDILRRDNGTDSTVTDTNSTTGTIEEVDDQIVYCDVMPSGLGPVNVDMENMNIESLEQLYPEVDDGGLYTPSDCTPYQRVAIIIPFRDRMEHLAIFLRHMHPFLQKQKIQYGIFVIEQHGNGLFNRGKLMNVGFAESEKLMPEGWDCFVFHDVDLLPLDTRNMYACPGRPRHMSAAIDIFQYQLPYKNIFGGVSALTREQFINVNGFSNKYWGWGGEDDNMFRRITAKKYKISRYKMSLARYKMIKHTKSKEVNKSRFKLLESSTKEMGRDGLTSLKYKVLNVTKYHLYTYIDAYIDD